MSNPVEAARRVKANSQYEKVDGVLLDLTTANAIVAVADALSPDSRSKLESMDIERAARICWKLVS